MVQLSNVEFAYRGVGLKAPSVGVVGNANQLETSGREIDNMTVVESTVVGLSRGDMYLKLVRSLVVDSGVSRVFFGPSSVIPSLNKVMNSVIDKSTGSSKWVLKQVSSGSLFSHGFKEMGIKGNGLVYVMSCTVPMSEMCYEDLTVVKRLENKIEESLELFKASGASSSSKMNMKAGMIGVWFGSAWITQSTWMYWSQRASGYSVGDGVTVGTTLWHSVLHRDIVSLLYQSIGGLVGPLMMMVEEQGNEKSGEKG